MQPFRCRKQHRNKVPYCVILCDSNRQGRLETANLDANLPTRQTAPTRVSRMPDSVVNVHTADYETILSALEGRLRSDTARFASLSFKSWYVSPSSFRPHLLSPPAKSCHLHCHSIRDARMHCARHATQPSRPRLPVTLP